MIRKPNAIQKLFHRLLMRREVSGFMAKYLHRADSWALRLTRGHYTFTGLVGLPIVQLTMTGAKTGTLRTLTLAGIPDGNRLVLFATNFGQKHNPAWYYNLKANPECIVQRRGNKSAFLAREEEGDEYERYWQLGVSYYEGYALYRECAGHRHLPIMVLEPIQSR